MSGIQIIDVPGQGEIEFPADMSDDQITAVIKRNLLSPMQKRMGVREMAPGSMRPDTKDLPYSVGGRMTDATGSPALGAVANAATEVATDPLTYLGGAAGRAAYPLLRKAGERVMQMALKPNKAARDSGDATKAVKTLLEEGANVSEGGVTKLTEKIDALDQQLSDAIAESTAKLKNTDLLKGLKGVLDQYRAGTNQAKNIPEIEAVQKRLLEHPAFGGSDEISVQGAQAMKRQNYKELKRAYGKPGGEDAQTDALKAVTHDLRTGIEAATPEAAGINAQMSPLINARDLAQERSLVAGNNNIVGIGWMNPKTIIPWLMERNPAVASYLARFLYSGAAPIAQATGAGLGGGIGALLQQAGQQQ